MIKQTFTRTALAATLAVGVLAASPAQAQADYSYANAEADYSALLSGNITNNAWHNLSIREQDGIPGNIGYGSFPGTNPWPAPIASQVNNAVGAGAASLDGASLNKLANGPAGGPYPAGGSIYYGGFSADYNFDGGKLGVTDTTVLPNVQTVVFQVGIGEAWGYDFWNGQLPTLSFEHAGGAVTGLNATFNELLSAHFNGTVSMPTGPEDVYINQYAMQWDLTAYSGISSLEVSFHGVQHAQLYGLTLTQSDVFSQVVSAVPEPQTYAMLMAGLGVVGGIARRRRKA